MKRTQSSLANELNIRAVAALDEAREMPPADGRTKAMRQAESFEMPLKWPSISSARVARQPSKGSSAPSKIHRSRIPTYGDTVVDTALAPYLEREERSDGPPSRKAQLPNTADRDARQATQGRRPVNLCVDRFRVRIRRTNSLCDFVGDISWYSGIVGRIKSCRRFLTRRHSQRATMKSDQRCPAA